MTLLFPSGGAIPISRVQRVEITQDDRGIPCALVHIGPLLPGAPWGARIERVDAATGTRIIADMRRFARATGRAGCQNREVAWAAAPLQSPTVGVGT